MDDPFLSSSSFEPPALDAAEATPALGAAEATPALGAAEATPARYPVWVLLDKKAYFDDRENATTRDVMTSTGHTVKVTFFLADPPAVSYFCVHSPKLDRKKFHMEPRVVFSVKNLVLLCFAFTVGPRSTKEDCYLAEYFVYKADCGNPSIIPIPTTPPGCKSSWNAIILPCDDGEFFIADLYKTLCVPHYDLHVFSSKTEKWSTKPLKLQTSRDVMRDDLPKQPHKVIALEGGVVGWVDLWRGIVACNVLAEVPVLSFIPLPKPEFNLSRKGDPRPMRDVTSFNGFLNFIEIEHYSRQLNILNKRSFKVTKDLDSADIIYDSELLLDDIAEVDDKPVFVPDGWKIRTCYRSTSWGYWHKSHSVHVDDISVNPEHYVLLPQLWDGFARKWTLRNMTTGYPTLSIHGDGVVYLMSKPALYDENAWIVGIDLEKKTVETIKPYSSVRARCFNPAFLPCAFSEYLNTNPRPCSEERTPNWDQDCELDDHLSLGYTSPNNVLPQLNMWNEDGYGGSLNEYADAAHAGYGNYQQPTLSQPEVMPTPHTPEVLYPISTSSESGYAYLLDTQPRNPAWSTRGPSLHPTDPAPPFFTPMMHWRPWPPFFTPMMHWSPEHPRSPVMPSASWTAPPRSPVMPSASWTGPPHSPVMSSASWMAPPRFLVMPSASSAPPPFILSNQSYRQPQQGIY